MKTRTFTITHASLVGFDGKSKLWMDFQRLGNVALHQSWHLQGSRWHLPCKPESEVAIIGDFRLGEKSVVELNDKRYVAWTNFGFDQKVLAFSIVGIEGEDLSPQIFTNSVKLYTSELTTEKFLAGANLFI